jgi:monovalent cation:H+ antiporter, CPA1 family
MASIELVVSAFLLLTFIAALVSIRLKIPYTLILILTGVSITVVVTLLSIWGPLQAPAHSITLQIQSIYSQLIQGGTNSLFVGLIVPPLIFEAMIQIKGSELKTVIKPSLALATLGVLIATAVGGLFLWKVVGLSMYVSFLFSALIAPTDVVTVLEIFRRVKVPSKLATMLDFEAAFNDATGIVVFTIVLSTIGLARVSLLDSVVSFGFTLGVGVLVGLGVAFLGEILSSLIEDKSRKQYLPSSLFLAPTRLLPVLAPRD